MHIHITKKLLFFLSLLQLFTSKVWGLNFQTFIEKALKNNPYLASINLETEINKQHLVTEKRKYWPKIQINLLSGITEGEPFLDYGDLISSELDKKYRFWGEEFIVLLPILQNGSLIGTTSPEVNISKLEIEKSKLNYISVKNLQIENLAKLYTDVISLREEYNYEKYNLFLQKLKYEKSSKLFKQKAISKRQKMLSELYLKQAELSLNETAYNLKKKIKIIQTMLGLEKEPSIEDFHLPLISQTPKNLNKFLKKIKKHNPEILESKFDIEIAKETYNLTKKKVLPEINLETGLRYYENFNDQSRSEFFLILKCNWSFGFDILSERKEHFLSTKKAKKDYFSAISERKQEVINSFYQLHTLFNDIQSAEIDVNIEKIKLEEIEEQFYLGKVSLKEVYEQKLKLLSKIQNLKNLKIEYFLNTIHLKHLIGLNWNDPWP